MLEDLHYSSSAESFESVVANFLRQNDQRKIFQIQIKILIFAFTLQLFSRWSQNSQFFKVWEKGIEGRSPHLEPPALVGTGKYKQSDQGR